MTADAVGGVWTYALDLADALAPHGVEVHLATMGERPDEGRRRAVERSAVAGLHESPFRLEWEDDPWADVERAGDWLLGLATELRPDLVHLNGYAHAALEWPAPVVVVAHSDVLSWWRAVRRSAPPVSLDRYRDRVELGLQSADVVVAPTHAVFDDLSANYVFETRRVVVPNGRAAHGVPAAAKEAFVAGVGRFWDDAKNIALLERVATRLPWPVLLAGPGAPLGRLAPEETTALLGRASIFASPALYEPFGLAALEAAQAGCALVLSDIASFREVWGDAAVYAAAEDDEAFLDAIRGLCDDPVLLAAMAERAQRRAARYTPEATAERMLAVYGRARALEAVQA
jgi:glycogen(starch) synthase